MKIEIEKKVLSKYFKQIQLGKKTYELRLADWDCKMGDKLLLIEIDDKTKEPTGRKLTREVGFVFKTKDCDFWPAEDIEKYGFQVISLIDDADDLYKDAVQVVIGAGKASASLLQRRLRVGYARAAGLIEKMESEGLIGSADGGMMRRIIKK